MADNNIMSNQENFLKGFSSSVTKMSGAIASFVAGVDAFNSGNFEFVSMLEKWGKTFSFTNIILTLEKMTREYNDARLELAKTFGVYGERRTGLMSILQDERQEFIRYGIGLNESLETTLALSDKFGSIDFVTSQQGLISTTALISKSFNVSAEAAAELTSQFALFAGRDALEIKDTMEYMATMADAAGVSTSAVFENMKSAANVMYLFNLQGANADKKMADLAVFATGIGLDLGSATTALKAMRDPMNAIKASAELARVGIMTTSTELMSMSFGGPEAQQSGLINLLSQLQGFDPAIQAQQFEVIADKLGQSPEQIAKSFERMEKVGFNKLIAGDAEALKELENMAEASMGFTARLDALMKSLFTALDPIATMVFPALDAVFKWLAEHVKITRGIAIAVTGIFLLQKSQAVRKAVGGAFSGAAQTLLLKGMDQRGGTGSVSGWLADRFFPAASISAPSTPSAPTTPGGPGFGGITGKDLMQGAAGVLIMAGALFVMAKSFQEFEKLDNGWETFGLAAASIAALGLITAGLGLIATPLMAGGAALAAASVGFAVFGWAMGIFSNGISPLLGYGEDLALIGKGLMSIFGAIALMPIATVGGLIGSIFGGTSTMIRPLEELLQFAQNDLTPLKELGEVLTKISLAMESISDSQLSGLQADINTAGRGGGVPLQNNIRIDLDGRKLWDSMYESKAGKK